MATLRTKETEARYQKLISEGFLNDGCNLCKAPSIMDFEHWRIIGNLFPYDLIAKVHHMIIPKRHITGTDITETEKQELESLKDEYINQEYSYIIEAVKKGRSIPGHLHFHLITMRN